VSFLFALALLVVVLGVLIFVHELGHFMAAKAAGIRVYRFALGMGNPVPGLSFRRGNTEYAVCWLPLGGYVKMASREEAATTSPLEGSDADGRPAGTAPVEAREYFESKPVWVRMIVILAGVTMNVLFAWALFAWLAASNGEQIDPVTTVGSVATDSLPPGAGALASLRPGDRIVAVNGDTVRSWNAIEEAIGGASGDTVRIALADGRVLSLDIHPAAVDARQRVLLALAPFHQAYVDSVDPGGAGKRGGMQRGDTVVAIGTAPVTTLTSLIQQIRSSPGAPIELRVARAGGAVDLTVTPDSIHEDGRVIGRIGIGFLPAVAFERKPYSIPQAIVAGLRETGRASTQIVRTVQGLLSARIPSREVGGPILIGQLAAQSARLGLDTFLSFMALISVNLAVINLLPIPVLDGGQFFFLLAEAVRRRPLSLQLRERLTMVGLVLIVMLIVLAFKNDLSRNWGVITGFLGRLGGR